MSTVIPLAKTKAVLLWRNCVVLGKFTPADKAKIKISSRQQAIHHTTQWGHCA
jgi:hypothetical protein